MNALSLYDVAQDFKNTEATLLELDLPEEVIRDTLDGERLPVEQKAAQVGFVIRNIDATAELIEAEASRLSEAAKRLRKREAWLRSYLLMNMDACGITEIKAGALTIKLRNNPSSVDVFEPNLLPPDYLKEPPPPPPPAPDKKLIAQAIKDGFEVPGARLVNTKRVEIK